MSRGLNRHQERVQAVAGLGRNLSRRAGNRCELCADRTSLFVVEVEPLPEEPDEDAAVMVCERCRRAMAGGRGAPRADELRFLENSAWSDVAPVQVAAVRVLRRMAGEDIVWARDLNESLYLGDAVLVRLG